MTRPSRHPGSTAARVAFGLLAVLAAAMTVYDLSLTYRTALAAGLDAATVLESNLLYRSLFSLVSIAGAGLAVAVLWRGGAVHIHFGAAGALMAIAMADEGRFSLLRDIFPVLDRGILWRAVVFTGAYAVGMTAGVRWTQCYPRPLTAATLGTLRARELNAQKAAGRRVRGMAYVALRRLQAWLLHRAALWLGIGAGTFLLTHAHRFGVPLHPLPVMLAMGFVGLGVAAANLWANHRLGDADTRERIHWLLAAALAGLALGVPAVVIELVVHFGEASGAVLLWLHQILLPLAPLAEFVLLGFAVFYRGAVGGGLVLRRTALLAPLGLVLTTAFVLLEELLSSGFAGRLGLPPLGGSVLAGTLVALAAAPLHRWLHGRSGRVVDRLVVAEPDDGQRRRATNRYVQRIEAAPEQVFPLLCPVREAEWLPGFEYRMVHSVSGVAELGVVFTTMDDAGTETVWTVTRYRPPTAISFFRVTPGLMTTHIDIDIEPGEDGSHVHIGYTFTALSDAGDRAVVGMSDADWTGKMEGWERAMNHWLRTGQPMKPEQEDQA